MFHCGKGTEMFTLLSVPAKRALTACLNGRVSVKIMVFKSRGYHSRLIIVLSTYIIRAQVTAVLTSLRLTSSG